jgi:hypothetical protein
MEIMVAQPDFECAYGGVRCTHVHASCHVWEFQIRWLVLGQCNDVWLDQCPSLLTWTFDHKHMEHLQSMSTTNSIECN